MATDYEIYREKVQCMPKIDLHVHLGGCFLKDDLWDLAQKYRRDITKEKFDGIFTFRSFDDFSHAWKFKNTLIKEYVDFEFLMNGVVKYLKDENIVYWEPAIAMFELEALDPAELLNITTSKLNASDIKYSFVMDLIRGEGVGVLRSQYEFYHSLSKYCPIRGIGLAGNEVKHGLSKELIPIFAKAKEDGYGIAIHASEIVGQDHNVKIAVESFGADRIGHGYDLGTNWFGRNHVVGNSIHAEYSPLSLGAWSKFSWKDFKSEMWALTSPGLLEAFRINDFPMRRNFSICSDDPGMFDTTLSCILIDLGCSIDDYSHLMHVANRASFASSETKDIISSVLYPDAWDSNDRYGTKIKK